MKELKMDFYNPTNLKSYDLNDSMRYQLAVLNNLDVFTRLHSENVANLTCRICEYMHMKSYFTVYCTMCAYLHDIGKQFIPSSILQKNGKLTPEEYEIMKTHTTLGYNICMKDENLHPYIAGPLYHHEALDGSGYPNGISAPDLPLEGQIIRVADEFDAIVSKRQYKSHVGICDTLNILLSETIPIKNVNTENALNELISETIPDKGKKVGKVNPKVVKALIKVVLDDTEYEIYNLSQYVNYLKAEVKRLEKIEAYVNAMNNAHKESDKEYYLNGINALFSNGETLENYKDIQAEYMQAYVARNDQMNRLIAEFKNIKKLKV